MTDKDEIAALKARVAELEARAKPPEPFVPEPYQRFDPTAGMSMPRSVMREMVNAVPDRVMQDIVREQRTSSVNQGPSAAGASGTATKTSSSPGLPGTVAWSQSGNAGRW
jgi:hypothetical protein